MKIFHPIISRLESPAPQAVQGYARAHRGYWEDIFDPIF
jgi:hypothetical protein